VRDAVVVSAGFPPVSCLPVLAPARGARTFADGELLAGGFGQRHVGLDLVAVAAPVLLLDHIAGLGQVGDDAISAALGDARPGRDVA
jgi:hypothetical protein